MVIILAKKNKKKRSKFGVDTTEKGKQKRTYKGILYDSKMEMDFFKECIEPKLKTGEIISCQRQVEYILQEGFSHNGKKILPIKYRSDFNVTYVDGSLVVYDVKGRADNTALLKRKMFWYKYPDIDYRWVCKSIVDGGWLGYDEMLAARRRRKKERKLAKEAKKD